MKRITLNQIKKAKDEHCAEVPGSWKLVTNLCKRYIEQETNNADYGEKTNAKKKASKAATGIVNGNCKLGKKGKKSKKAAKSQSITKWYGDLSPTTKILAGVGIGFAGMIAFITKGFTK